ncbi:hypothetical protein PENARI_c060G01118 [Penicillium arizonense]|uniref:polynucleotide adenylyltransferase n=1 Tax=Penicillium arizonense TaxID=1835702 RepID=A0A1F5L1L5_PENAI|nr:hypothetical protein PENARI_c060G01118 [Penicillium arizonense]OGE47138.1 hypothetical protein PENARI_c060G01118 [Penicillium arizonense]
MGLDGAQDTTLIPPPCSSALRWPNPDPYTALPPPSEQTNNKVDVVKLIRKARLDNVAKADETDELRENFDFISLGIISESEPQSNAPENTSGLALKGPAGQENHEILRFYDWAKTQEIENIGRRDLVERLNIASKVDTLALKSMHLALLSLVSLCLLPILTLLLSDTFRRKGVRSFGERKGHIHAISGFLKSTNIAVPNSIECIAHAWVPILKFVDRVTGLRVDMSFDNHSGLIANGTFQNWKEQFPIMPVIVSVIKQFLLIRGLNEVSTGGLGGFSVTCLVTSLLQHLPHRHIQRNPGSILMEFFNFYGNHFQYDHMGIRLNPPGYFNKTYFGNPDRLTIEDPNNMDNDISGGTSEINLILRTFASAHTNLKNQNRFAWYGVPPPPPSEPDHVGGVHSAPPPLPAGPPPISPPTRQARRPRSKSKGTRAEPEDISDEYSSKTKLAKPRKGQVGRQARRWRAARIKRLRPDLKNLPSSFSIKQALRHAGYETNGEMKHDLNLREQRQPAA